MLKNYILLIFILSFLSQIACGQNNSNDVNIDKVKELFLQELEFEATEQEKENYTNYINQSISVNQEYEEKKDSLKDEIKQGKKKEKIEKKKQKKKLRIDYKAEIKKMKKETKEIKRSLKEEYNKKINLLEEKYSKEKKDMDKDSTEFLQLKENFKKDKFDLITEFKEKLEVLGEEKDNLKLEKQQMYDEYSKNKKNVTENLKKINKEYLIQKQKREDELINEENSLELALREKFKQDRKYYTEEEIRKDLLVRITKLKEMINNLSPNAITYVTNGTRIAKNQPESKYFFADKNTPNSYGYAQEVAELLNSKVGIFLDWIGENNDKSRVDAASNFYQKIKKELEIISMSQNISEKSIPINLVGHSHGGNIMIIVANKLKEEGFNVQFLFTFGTPVREYQLKYEIPHVQLYSYKDQYQKIGGWDFDFLCFDLKYEGRPDHKFKNALNINLIFFLDDELLDFYKNQYIKVHSNANYYHQITRYIGTIKKVIDGDLVYKGSL